MQAYGAGSFARGSPLSANRISSCASMTPVRAALSRIDSREMNTGRTPSEVAQSERSERRECRPTERVLRSAQDD